MADQPCTYPLSQQRGKGRSDEVHFLAQVGHEGFTVVSNGNDTGCESRDVEHVKFGY